jgi:hypothetical protein
LNFNLYILQYTYQLEESGLRETLCKFDWSFPTSGLRIENFIVEQTTLTATSNKIVKYKKTCSDNQHIFIPFAFNTFDLLAPETVNLLRIFQRVIHNVVSSMSMNIIFRG